MLKSLLDRFAIRPFERAFDYDAGYMRALLAASPATFLKFSILTGLVVRRDAPAEALAAAGIVATLREDCGPCTQIGVDIAVRGGVDRAVLRAILAGDEAAMGDTAALAYRFAQASLDRDLNAADPLRDEIVRRWGQKALVAIALTITTGRMYPTLKYALGYGKTCSRVTVAGEAAPFERPRLLAA
ncbi:MAG TPA: hypothetical protein VMT68_18865 [Caulobacteraceae bacterium]|nr:hypothetical protein [Caulobacteraceae bacterium]